MSQRKVISKGVLSFVAALTAGALGYTFSASALIATLVVIAIAFIFALLSAAAE